MALSKKPKKKTTTTAKKEADIQAIINRGGSVSSSVPKQEPVVEKKMRLQLRLLPRQVELIDSLIDRGVFRKSRHSWILEAIEEKIQREMGEGRGT